MKKSILILFLCTTIFFLAHKPAFSALESILINPSGVASSNGFSSAGGGWADILDTNDGDGSYAHSCCGPGVQSFYVDMDDPAALQNATIENLSFYVYARYLNGPWPGGVPYVGYIDVGYKTGASTVWSGSTTTDPSGAYSLISSFTYSTDSDGGALDLTDINNLQIAVKRNTYGPPQLRVTEVFAEVNYSTPVAPEPVSSVLFIVGGATLGFKRFRKKLI